MKKLPIILHIPHSSNKIPENIRMQFKISDIELEEELRKMTDWFTEDLFTQNSDLYHIVKFPVSRLVVDPERFLDDSKEIMAQKGMGVIYISDSEGKSIRKKISEDEKEHLIRTYYFQHHNYLNSLVKKIFAEFGKCLIVDCHSFPAKPLSYEFDQKMVRPDFCIGTDSFHTSSWLVENINELFNSYNYSIAHNAPFSGSFVPGDYFQKNKKVQSVMIEVNRSLYMDESTILKKSNYRVIRKDISSILNKLCLNFTERLIDN